MIKPVTLCLCLLVESEDARTMKGGRGLKEGLSILKNVRISLCKI
jgi:hypothetical protein